MYGNGRAMLEGDLLATESDPHLGPGGGYQITDIRPDGTTVGVLGSKPLTQDQLTAVARAGGLTLFS